MILSPGNRKESEIGVPWRLEWTRLYFGPVALGKYTHHSRITVVPSKILYQNNVVLLLRASEVHSLPDTVTRVSYRFNRLPRSYVKWIGALANVDGRLLHALNLLRDGKRWSYLRGSAEYHHLLTSYSQELGFPNEWGDPSRVPPYGGQLATSVWQALGVQSRPGVGGIPCEVVHGRLGRRFGLSSSCTANAFIRCMSAFIEAIVIYLPVWLHLHASMSFLDSLRNRCTSCLSFSPVQGPCWVLGAS